MTGPDTRPTPALGIPAVDPTSEAKPGSGEDRILAAFDGLRTELRTEMSARFAGLEATSAEHGKALMTLTNQVTEHGAAITSVARSVAYALEVSAKAQAEAGTVKDDTRKMVESAMEIQKGAIAAAVVDAVRPIRDDVDKQSEAMGAIVDELGLEDQVALGREVKPGEKKPIRTLQKMARENKAGTFAAVLTFLTLSIALAIKLLSH